MAMTLSQQLISQLEAKVAAMPNDPDKFLMTVKLQEQADILRVSSCFSQDDIRKMLCTF
jgi:hypothetical protein